MIIDHINLSTIDLSMPYMMRMVMSARYRTVTDAMG
jgi:hypothetical protein